MKVFFRAAPLAAVVFAIYALAGLSADNPPVVPAAAPAKSKDDGNSTRGKLDEVTVYRGQALITRLVDVPGRAGLREVVVTDLPEHVQPSSIYAENAEGVEVRSVRYRIRPVEQDVRDEVRKLDAEIRQVQDAIQANAQQTRVLGERKTFLEKLQQFTAPTANAELTKGVLNAETLKVLTTFMFDQGQTVATAQLKATQEQRDLNEKLNLRQREREVLTGGSAKTIREAVVFVNLKEANGRLRLRYLVDGASWAPSYNARADGKGQITVEYNAAIEQMSGEDWTDVTMALSTATPSLVAKAPALEPLTIALSAGTPANIPPGAKSSASGYWSAKKDLDERRKAIDINRSLNGNFSFNAANTYSGVRPSGGTVTGSGTLQLNQAPNAQPQAVNPTEPGQPQQQMAQVDDFDTTLNDVARESQVLDLINTARIEKGAKPGPDRDGEGVSVSYQLAGRTSLPSRADRQLIQIAAVPMKAEVYRIAKPVLTSAGLCRGVGYQHRQDGFAGRADFDLCGGSVRGQWRSSDRGHRRDVHRRPGNRHVTASASRVD